MVMILWAASFITSRMIGATWMSSTGRENESAFSPAGAFCRPTARAMARGSGLSRKPTEAAPRFCCRRNITGYAWPRSNCSAATYQPTAKFSRDRVKRLVCQLRYLCRLALVRNCLFAYRWTNPHCECSAIEPIHIQAAQLFRRTWSSHCAPDHHRS